MTRLIAVIFAGLVFTAGCAQSPSSSSNRPLGSQAALTGDAPAGVRSVSGSGSEVATVNGKPITIEQLQRPLVDAYGLPFLLHLVQIELCKQKAQAAGVTVMTDDIAAERQLTLEQMFESAVQVDEKLSADEQKQFRQKEFDRLLDQFLASQRISRPEFDLAMETGAYLRKLAEPGLKEQITEQHLREGFNIMFGEKVRVRHIQFANMREVAEAQRRLAEGQSFETIAADMTQDARSRTTGGEIRAFSRAEPLWPQAFKDAAFALKEPGDVSNPVHSGESIHLIKLIQKIPPSAAVKFESHREIVREELYKGLLMVRIRQLREAIAAEARSALRISDPVLRKQYVERLERASGQTTQDASQVRREITIDRSAATQPARISENAPLYAPVREGSRPPATMPGR